MHELIVPHNSHGYWAIFIRLLCLANWWNHRFKSGEVISKWENFCIDWIQQEMGYIAFVYAVIFASGKHSRLLLAYGNSKPPLSGNQGNLEIDGGSSSGRVSQFARILLGQCTLRFVRFCLLHGVFFSKGDY